MLWVRVALVVALTGLSTTLLALFSAFFRVYPWGVGVGFLMAFWTFIVVVAAMDFTRPVEAEAVETDDLAPLHIARTVTRINRKLRALSIRAAFSYAVPGVTEVTFYLAYDENQPLDVFNRYQHDLCAAMRVKTATIAAVTEKNLIAISVPDEQRRFVTLAEIIDQVDGQSPLMLVFGRGQDGLVLADLAVMPHLLIAGSTGSGKSTLLNLIIATLLSRNQPNELQLILIDAKEGVEFGAFDGVAHLKTAVIAGVDQALSMLRWLVDEMERRYREIAAAGCREIGQYNRVLREQAQPDQCLPYLVTVIDEMADLVIRIGAEFEQLLLRLTQKARAAGVHLILATQRPSAQVLSGDIKSNLRWRIALSVPTKVDSRVILDQNGAESLGDRGDALLMQPGAALLRLQCAYVEAVQMENILAVAKSLSAVEPLDITATEVAQEPIELEPVSTSTDALFEPARAYVLEIQAVSLPKLQKRFGIGEKRAGKLIDLLEQAGVIGPSKGSGKTRDVLLPPPSPSSESA